MKATLLFLTSMHFSFMCDVDKKEHYNYLKILPNTILAIFPEVDSFAWQARAC